MKAMAILFRVLFSAIVLLALALYQQHTPTVSLAHFFDSLTPEALCNVLGGINTTTVLLTVIVLLGIFSCTRILEAAWNVLFCASILLLLAGGAYTAFGPSIALPNAIYHNEAVNQLCQALPSYQVGVAIVSLIFVAGWLCAAACVRVAITAVVSYGLWYAITEFFSYIVYLWANRSEPAMPEVLNMIQSTPWVLAAVPAAFFLIYALLMAFFETFISHKPANKVKDKSQQQPAATDKAPEDNDSKSAEKTKAVDAPKLKVKPVAPPKTKDKPAEEAKAEEAPKTEDKPAEEAKAEEAPKTEDKPAEEDKAEEAPKTEDKPAEEAKAEEAPKTEDKPAEEAKAEEAPKAEDKPAEEARAEEATKTEDKPAEEATDSKASDH
ncbi:MAG: hypothetical protein IIV41_09410 [Akkermansia sp.]|nr:hypothetical protein [Akkermansia sp.]